MDLSRLYEPALLQLIVATVETPQGDLASIEVTLRKWGRVILHNYDDICPVLPVEMITYPVTSPSNLVYSVVWNQ